MVTKALWTSILVVGLLAVGGLGFATFTAQQNVVINGTAGTLSIAVYNYTTEVSNSSYMSCWATSDGAYLNFSAGPFAPGDWCTVYGNITNTGNLPAHVLANWPHFDNGCFTQNITYPSHNPSVPPSGRGLLPGHFEMFEFTLELPLGAGNSCMGVTGWVEMTFTATSPA